MLLSLGTIDEPHDGFAPVRHHAALRPGVLGPGLVADADRSVVLQTRGPRDSREGRPELKLPGTAGIECIEERLDPGLPGQGKVYGVP